MLDNILHHKMLQADPWSMEIKTATITWNKVGKIHFTPNTPSIINVSHETKHISYIIFLQKHVQTASS